MTLSLFLIGIDRYMLDCSAKGLSKKTLSSYEQTLKLFVRYMLDTFAIDDVKDVTADHLQAYIRSIEDRGKFQASFAKTPVSYPGDEQTVASRSVGRLLRIISAIQGVLFTFV
ncbi:site-specific integrase [Lysinibacillus odysseyi]|uniref:site-specific integrase n=1 Tax=Lysinibacillus odysseyi TaxID=202611 RepID=UPI0006924170|nr:site-specific integrase [Lysinibacillus odysseyi]